MENKRFRQARHTSAQLAIARQLLKRGLIDQSEYQRLEQALTNNCPEISRTQGAAGIPNPKNPDK